LQQSTYVPHLMYRGTQS